MFAKRVDLIIASFVSVVLVLIPLPVFWKARNWTIVALIGWMSGVNMIQGINSIFWADNVEVKYVVWCDIATKIGMGSSVAVLALLVCLYRSMALIASGKNVTSTTADKRQDAMLALFAGVGLPIIYMVIHYVVQPERFSIIEGFGCRATIYLSIPSLLLTYLPPILISFAALIYAGLGLMYYVRRRRDIFVRGRRSQYGLTPGIHVRLVALSVALMISAQTMTIWGLIGALEYPGLQPWISWEHVHANLFEISQWSQADSSPESTRELLLISYFPPVISVGFFAFFGCSRTVWAWCVPAWQWVRGRMSCARSASPPMLPLSSNGSAELAASTIDVPPSAKLTHGALSAGDCGSTGPAQVACPPCPSCEPACSGSTPRAGL